VAGAPVEARWRVAFSAAALLALASPAAVWGPAPEAIPSAGARPVRVVTYNVHKGFDTRGHLDLEAIARAIEAESPDVVALQEVSRGQITECDVDMASWLSRRLGLPCVYTPTGVPLWGQAVLTRLPVLRAESRLLPPRLPTTRSYGYVELDAGWGEPLRLVDTHYTAVFGDASRLAHSEALGADLAARGLRNVVVAGDLNATPDSPPLRVFYDLGLADAVGDAGLAPGYTAPTVRPTVRIDYILHSPDLDAADVSIGRATASDHLSVAATIGPKSGSADRTDVQNSGTSPPPPGK
jgi:endonuclease/exonuclease/phosphatase family metal-dependent hydrolase